LPSCTVGSSHHPARHRPPHPADSCLGLAGSRDRRSCREEALPGGGHRTRPETGLGTSGTDKSVVSVAERAVGSDARTRAIEPKRGAVAGIHSLGSLGRRRLAQAGSHRVACLSSQKALRSLGFPHMGGWLIRHLASIVQQTGGSIPSVLTEHRQPARRELSIGDRIWPSSLASDGTHTPDRHPFRRRADGSQADCWLQ
jgi:hypothetical protein